jgi:DNA polymerase (family 10)
MNLDFAEKCAVRIVAWLTPYCDQIAVAGSIRRRRPLVNDVDIVLVPKSIETRDLLGTVVAAKNLATAAIAERVMAEHWTWITGESGGQIMSFSNHGVQVDVNQATEETLGSVLICKTGSKEHNIWLARRAQSLGLHWNPIHGVFRGDRCLASRREEDVFNALGLDFIPPELRER